jgi:hypothetical protein
MKLSFETALIEIWRQVLINAKTVVLGAEHFPVRRTPKRGLRQVDFVFEGNEIRGLEQNPETKSRWAQMARSGKKVMQFLNEGRYVANVTDGKLTLYGGRLISYVTPQRESWAGFWYRGPPESGIIDPMLRVTKTLDNSQTTADCNYCSSAYCALTCWRTESHPSGDLRSCAFEPVQLFGDSQGPLTIERGNIT